MKKEPCKCKTENKAEKILQNVSQVDTIKQTNKTISSVIISFLKIVIPVTLFISVILLIIPFVLFLIFSKRAKRGFVVKLPLQKLLKNV